MSSTPGLLNTPLKCSRGESLGGKVPNEQPYGLGFGSRSPHKNWVWWYTPVIPRLGSCGRRVCPDQLSLGSRRDPASNNSVEGN